MTAGSDLAIRRTSAGIVFTVRVLPRSSHPGIAGLQEGALKVRIAAPPVDGKANEACLQLIAEVLGIKKGQVTLLAGHTSRNKTVAVAGISPERLQRCIAAQGDRE